MESVYPVLRQIDKVNLEFITANYVGERTIVIHRDELQVCTAAIVLRPFIFDLKRLFALISFPVDQPVSRPAVFSHQVLPMFDFESSRYELVFEIAL